MGIDDQRTLDEESRARRLTLVRGAAREPAPHPAPKLELIAHAERELVLAVMQNDPRRVSAWLARGADPNARDCDGRTALYEAGLRWKQPAIAELLLDHGADLRVRDKDGQTPLHAAAMFADEAQLRLFLDRGAEIDARDARAQTPLHCAADLGRVEAVTYLVSRGADVSVRDQDGRTPQDLLRATMRQDPQQEYRWALLERLLGDALTMKLTEAGLQRYVADWGLLEALRDNDPHGVATWLARGADANLRGEGGRTPLFEAALPWKAPTIAKDLLARGADVQARDEHDQTPLHVAAFHGGEARIGLLLYHGAEIDVRDAAGRTPLHCAAGLGRVDAATLLVKRGADVSVRDQDGRTPLDCMRKNHELGLLGKEGRQPLEQLLRGFLTAKVVEARPDSLVIQVESVHWKYPDAQREAKERGTFTLLRGLFRKVPEAGDCLRCAKGVSPVLDEVWDKAWRVARQRDLGIEPVR